MAIYIGGTKCKLCINGVMYNINIPTSTPITNGVILLSSDGFSLTDSNGLKLIPKEEYDDRLLPLDNHILKDLNEVYLTTRKDG